jgi:hypothetical protein
MKWSAKAVYDEEHADLTEEQRRIVRRPEHFYNEGMELGAGQPPTTGPESPWTWSQWREEAESGAPTAKL